MALSGTQAQALLDEPAPKASPAEFSPLSICNSFYSFMHVPIACWLKEDRVASIGLPNGCEPDTTALPILMHINEGFPLAILKDGMLYGLMVHMKTGHKFIIGPLAPHELDGTDIHTFLTFHQVPKAILNGVRKVLFESPVIDEPSFGSFLVFASCCLNGSYQEFDTAIQEKIIQSIDKIHESAFKREDVSLYSSWDKICQITDLVHWGNIEGIWQCLRQGLTLRSLVTNTQHHETRHSLRPVKNTFLMAAESVWLTGATGGGISTEPALQLLSEYTGQCEHCHSESELDLLFSRMIIDATTMVVQAHTPTGTSSTVRKCTTLMGNQLSTVFTIEELAQRLSCSRTFLTRHFKAETGMTVSQYSTALRIDRAMDLLRHTDLPLSEISSMLGFSSQSHFSNTFKEKTGTTPGNYRNATQTWLEDEAI